MRTFNFNKYVYAPVMLLLFGSAANAAPCTNSSLNGAYGFQEQGEISEFFSEFRSVGVLTFDGKGNATMAVTVWYSNFQVPDFQPGFPVTYAVSPDCRFSFTYTGNGEVFSGVIVNGGQKLLWLETSGDPMRTGQAEKVRSNQ